MPSAPALASPDPLLTALTGDRALRRAVVTLDLPLARHTDVVHIGTLERPTRRGTRGTQEGVGLSVSEHPEAWSAIARLGGRPWWQLTARGTAAQFLDLHARTKAQRTALADLAVRAGLVTRTTRFAVSWIDTEIDQRCTMLVATQAEADAEVEARDGEDGVRCKAVPGVEVTPAFLAYWRRHFGARARLDPIEMEEQAVLLLLQGTTRASGAWWTDRLAPAQYSAPRGVIWEHALPAWTTQRLPDPPSVRPRR